MIGEKFTSPLDAEAGLELTKHHHELAALLTKGGVYTVTGDAPRAVISADSSFFRQLCFADLEEVRRTFITTKKIPPNSVYIPKNALLFFSYTEETSTLMFAAKPFPREYVHVLASYLTRTWGVPVSYDTCISMIKEVAEHYHALQPPHIKRKRYAGKAVELAERGFDRQWKRNIDIVAQGGYTFSRLQFEEYRGLFFDCLSLFADKTIQHALVSLTPDTPLGLYEKKGGVFGPSALSKAVEYTPLMTGPEWQQPRDLDALFVSLSQRFQDTLEKALAEYTLHLESTENQQEASVYDGYAHLVTLGQKGEHVSDLSRETRTQLYYLMRGGFNTCIDSFMQFCRDCFSEIYARAMDAEEQMPGTFLSTVHAELLSSWHILMAGSALHIMDFSYLTERLMPFFGTPRSSFYQVDSTNEYYLDPQLLRNANGYRFREDQRKYFPFRTLPKQGCPARQQVSGEKSSIEKMIEWMACVTTYTVFAEVRSKARQSFAYRRALVARSLKNKITRL